MVLTMTSVVAVIDIVIVVLELVILVLPIIDNSRMRHGSLQYSRIVHNNLD